MISPLDALVKTFFKKHDRSWQMYLIQNWQTITGSLHSRICLEKIQGDTVVIGVYDAHWMQELFILQSMLIDMMNASFDKQHIKQVRFKLAKKRPELVQKSRQVVCHRTTRAPRSLTAAHEDALAAVKDQQLQKVLYTLLQHCSSAP